MRQKTPTLFRLTPRNDVLNLTIIKRAKKANLVWNGKTITGRIFIAADFLGLGEYIYGAREKRALSLSATNTSRRGWSMRNGF
jgi:hypothetical protein